MQLTVCIPTYQREELLEECLVGLTKQTAPTEAFDVLIIDNAGTEQCKSLAKKYNARYINEQIAGHSQARNRGWQSTTNEWILYLDDDAIPRPNLISILLSHLPTDQYAVIGGRYVHRHLTPPPGWLKCLIGEGHEPDPKIDQPTLLSDKYYIPGCIIAFSVKALKKINGFQTHLGMKEKGIGFGDEDDVQRRLREQGEKVLYDPNIIIDHLYQPYKREVSNQLKLAHQQGMAHYYLGTKGPTTSLQLLIRFLEITLVVTPITMVRWLITHREWYWQNAYLIIASKYSFALGFYRAFKNKNRTVLQ